MIEQQGWKAIRFPTIEILRVKNPIISEQLNSLSQQHWLIFISRNAVNFALDANSGKIDDFKKCSIAAVGKATAAALQSAGLTVDLLPENDFNSEGLLATAEMNRVAGKKCLIIRGQGGRETLAQALKERGAQVEYMEVYSREKPLSDDLIVCDRLRQGKLHGIIVTSGEALNNLLALINRSAHKSLYAVPLIVISQRIKLLAEQLGFKEISVTEGPGDVAIIDMARIMRKNSIINK